MLNEYIFEPQKNIPITGSYDIVVVGGGVAGVSAAIAAARNDAKVCIIEKQCALGGLATLGNVTVFLPLCDGKGNQVIGGIAEELLRLSIIDGFDEIPDCWQQNGNPKHREKTRFQVNFNPVSFMLHLEEFVINNNISILYDTKFCDVSKVEDTINAVVLEGKQGRFVLKCKCVVDASGDADVCAASGEKTVSLDNNVPAGWFYIFDGKEIKQVKFSRKYSAYGEKSEEGYCGDNACDVTKNILRTRELIKQQLNVIEKENKGQVLSLVSIPTIACLRMTRRLIGEIELEEKENDGVFEDEIGTAGDWRKAGPVYHIPLRCLVARKTRNLITAGRCISANSAWEITRAIPVCALTGEAAGTAAALASVKHRGSIDKLNINELRMRLKEQNAMFC